MSALLNLFEVVKLFMIGCFLLAGMFLLLMAMPQSRLREVVSPFVKLAFAAICLIYMISYIDLMPAMIFGSFSLLDGAVAVGGGVLAVSSAVHDLKVRGLGGGRRKTSVVRSSWSDDPFEL